MRFLLFLFLSLSFTSAFAVTKGQFMGRQMIINIASTQYDGSVDGTPQSLFEVMNRPEQDSFLGKGKALEAPQNVLNFVCARRGENNYQCSIYVHQSAYGRIAPGKAYFEMKGDQAKALFDQFHTNGANFSFRDEASTFAIWATPARFVIQFSDQGV